MDMCCRYIYRWMDGSADNAVAFGLTLIALLQGTSPEQSRFERALPMTRPPLSGSERHNSLIHQANNGYYLMGLFWS